MNYYELTFTYTSPVETSIINDVLAAELGEIGFESFAENENGLQGYISDQLYNVKGLQDKLAEFPLENVDIHFTETLVESKDWNEEWEKNYFKPIRIGKDCIIRAPPSTNMSRVMPIISSSTRRWHSGTGNHGDNFPDDQRNTQIRPHQQRTTRHGLRNSRTGHPCPYERSRTRGGHRH